MNIARLLLVVMALLLAIRAQAACRLEPMATVPIDQQTGHLLVHVAVNDVDSLFILDTGAERTLMSEEAVHRLGLERDSWVASTIRGIGGLEDRPNALPRSLRLGGVLLRRRTLTGDTSVTVGPIPAAEVAGRPIVGLLGRDFLSPFDLDLDLPEHRLSLFDVHDCAGGFLPWTTAYASVPASMPQGKALVLPLMLDGRPLRALLDTGASSSLITAPGMFRLGITPELLARDPTGNGRGIGPAAVPMHLHLFSELRVGPVATPTPRLWVAPVRVIPIVDMLLGLDWLRSRRVWLSFATSQVFVAMPSGGPPTP